MRISDHLFSRLMDHLCMSDPNGFKSPSLKTEGFQIDETGWSCLITDSAQKQWFIRPIAGKNGVPNPKSIQLATESNSLDLDDKQSVALRDSLRKTCNLQGIPLQPPHLSVVRCGTLFSLLVVECGSLQLVAELLQSQGKPPQAVAIDWQYQLESLNKNFLSFPTELSSGETFVTTDGMLLPIASALYELERSEEADVRLLETTPSNFSIPLFPSAPEWPRLIESTLEEPKTPWVPVSDVTKKQSQTLPRKLKSNLRRMAIASGIILPISATTYLFNDYRSSNQVANSRPPDSKDVIHQTNAESAENGSPITSNTPPDSGDLLTPSLETEPLQASGELTVQDLITQLQDQNHGLNDLAGVNASSIINEVLTEAKTTFPIEPADQSPGFESESQEVPEEELATVLSEKGIIALERPLQIKAAIAREFVSIGKPVVAKSCHCEIELKLQNKLIVEPSTDATIHGLGKQSWRIAIEDEDPELFLEIVSKPGSRWQIMTTVGLKESAGSTPILIGPRDAQAVGNRLILYRQGIDNAIEWLRTAKANRQARNVADISSEIKKLESQRREVNMAIDRWNVISRLTHLFYDQIEMRIQFSAAEKK